MGVRQDRTARPSASAVHDHLKFCRKLHREIARLLAAQNAIDISGGTTPVVYLVGTVGEQATVSDKDRWRVDSCAATNIILFDHLVGAKQN